MHARRSTSIGILLSIGLITAAVVVIWVLRPQSLPTRTLGLSGTTITVELATTPAQRVQGLSGRAALAADHGMLFVFPVVDRYGFWMKDMHFPIDIVWIGDNGSIVSVNESVLPQTYPTNYYPPEPVRLVLELPAGFAASHQLVAGSKITLPNW